MHKEGLLTAHFVQPDEFSDPEYHVFFCDDEIETCRFMWDGNEWRVGYFDNNYSYNSITFVSIVTLLDHINFLTRKERSKWTFGMI